MKSFNNSSVVKFTQKVPFLQHTDGTSAHSRQLSGSERSQVGGLLANSSVSKVLNIQFNHSNNILGYQCGNFYSIKPANYLGKI